MLVGELHGESIDTPSYRGTRKLTGLWRTLRGLPPADPGFSSHLEDHRGLWIRAGMYNRVVFVCPAEASPVVEGIYLGHERSQRSQTDRSPDSYACFADAVEYDLIPGLVYLAPVDFLDRDDHPLHYSFLPFATHILTLSLL